MLLAATLILARCRELRVDAIGGLTLGADPIAAAVATLSGDDPAPLRAFIVRKEVKAHGTGRAIEGPPLKAGDRIALVDDTTTTGSSFVVAQEAVTTTGAEIVEALVIVDREEGARESLAGHGMTLHSLFVRSDFSASSSPRRV
jgi:orotate phosphoribosyltransferase